MTARFNFEPHRVLMSQTLKNLLFWLLPAIAIGGIFAWGRFALVEPAPMIAACEGSAMQGICFWRQIIVEVFVHQRVGWMAVAAGLLSTVLRWSWLASVAVAAGVVALLLYTAELGAIGLLLGLLVLFRNAAGASVARASETTVTANQTD